MDWARRTSTVQHYGLPLLPSMPKEEKLACQCLVAGECLRSAAGRTLKRCANNFLTKVVKTSLDPQESVADGRQDCYCIPVPGL